MKNGSNQKFQEKGSPARRLFVAKQPSVPGASFSVPVDGHSEPPAALLERPSAFWATPTAVWRTPPAYLAISPVFLEFAPGMLGCPPDTLDDPPAMLEPFPAFMESSPVKLELAPRKSESSPAKLGASPAKLETAHGLLESAGQEPLVELARAPSLAVIANDCPAIRFMRFLFSTAWPCCLALSHWLKHNLIWKSGTQEKPPVSFPEFLSSNLTPWFRLCLNQSLFPPSIINKSFL